MNFRSTAILFGILFVVGIALLVMSFSESEPTASGDRVLAFASDIKAKDIDTIEFEKGSARLIVKRQDENHWSILQPITARADANAIDRDIDALLQLKATAHGELSANPAAHGLEPPSLRVTLRAGDTSETVNIGDVTGGSKAVAFVTTSNRARPMAVSRGDLAPLFKEATSGAAGDLAKWTNDYRLKQLFAVDSRSGIEDVTAIKLTAKKKELALAKNAGNWQFTSPSGWGDAAAT
ncbi:MAG TPA: DUF4340 domain-containing protein, partial [Gemmataceae bacterium]